MRIDETAARGHDFSAVRAAVQRIVDDEILPGVSYAVLRGRDVVDVACIGWADRENRVPLTADHLFRVFSNTKLVTSCAVLLLWEQGRIGLDDPVEQYLPQLAGRRVLKPGAQRIDDTEPAHGPITIRQLLSHSAGLSLGLLDPGSLIFDAYTRAGVRNPAVPLAAMIDALEALPLCFHPGTGWEYSVATDVLGRIVEVISGLTLDVFFAERIFGPLGMADTFFSVPPEKAHRLVACYRGASDTDPTQPGLTRTDDYPFPGAYLKPAVRHSGGGGLVSSLPDMVALVRGLIPSPSGGPTLLQPATLALLNDNQLPGNVWVQFANSGPIPGLGHGLASSVVVAPIARSTAQVGEWRWGGIAGTQWCISPRSNTAFVMMTQRQMAFFHPFAGQFKGLVYEAVARRG